MEVKEIIKVLKNLERSNSPNLGNFKSLYYVIYEDRVTEIIDLLKSLEAENKALKMLKQAQKDENKKECIRYQTMYRLKKENKKMKGYKRILEELKNNPFEGGDIDILINRLEKKYLGGEKC